MDILQITESYFSVAQSLGIKQDLVIPTILNIAVMYLIISKPLTKRIDRLVKRMGKVEHAITEIQTAARTKWKLTFDHVISEYGEVNSPITLKSELRHFIIDVGLDKQIESNKTKLVEWLKSMKPQTGLDAQTFILELVSTDEIDKYLDLEKYKSNLYEQGKTSTDAIAILGIYLFEALIPEILEEDSS